MSPTLSALSEASDASTLASMTRIARATGARLLAVFSPDARPASRDALVAAVRANDELASAGLADALAALRPQARWLDDDLAASTLPDGEWWVVDAVEGNVNHVHGLPDWAVTLTLLRDRQPVLAVVHQPVPDLTWTAVRGAGASRNGEPLKVGAKPRLDAAIAATGQAEVGQLETYGAIGASIAAMLGHALLVRTSVPSTFPMLQVAQGQADVFWQFAPTLPGTAAGVLIATEAGAVVSRLDGSPWQPGAVDILVTTPSLHAETLAVFAPAPIAEAA